MPHTNFEVIPAQSAARRVAVTIDQLPVTVVPLTAILGTLSPRSGEIDPRHVQALAERDQELPPILIHRPTMYVVDGRHRIEAARMRGKTQILARLLEGEEADAFVLATHSNISQGMRLSVRDRKHAARRISVSYPSWSDRRIAAATGLAARTVAQLRGCPEGTPETRVGRDGRSRPVNAAIGRERAARMLFEDPSLSLRQVARAVGISPETVRSVKAGLSEGQGKTPQETEVHKRQTLAVSISASSERPHPISTGQLARIQMLRRDPSLRFNDQGRMLLRLLDLHLACEPSWNTIIQTIPQHNAKAVAEIAHVCAVMWANLSQQGELSAVKRSHDRASR